ncbi:MAG: amidohydrolase family protein, partial [Clostridia bacterium]|nr:amidohydrolase family protein [Clostridia bacterium]
MSELLRIRSDRILTPDGWVDGVVTVEQGKIISVIPGGTEADLDYTGRALLPGFIDMHTHGAGGHDFLHSSPAEVLAGCSSHLRHGTTTILPTISAAPFADMRKAVADIAEVMESGEALGNILGAHMEGPYLS